MLKSDILPDTRFDNLKTSFRLLFYRHYQQPIIIYIRFFKK